MDDPFSRLRFALMGLPLSNIWQGHGSALFLEFGKLAARKRSDGTIGQPWGQVSVELEFDWRVELGRAIVCGSKGNRELWDAHFKRMKGKAAVDLTLVGDVPELCIELTGGYRLLTSSLHEDGPYWALADRTKGAAVWVYFENGQIIESEGLGRSS